MIPRECKRLAEVDFPIAVVSAHSAREKSIRHGHPSTLHLWWARRPLAACRAMLMALLLPDPADPLCPADFKSKARELLPAVQGKPRAGDLELRKDILRFIGDLANWDNAANRKYLEVGRGLVKAAHPEETPLVVDPFAGGGSIPLEALRLGCEAFASDLNPVACMILKTMLEDIPRHGPELADELRKVGAEIKEAAEKELADFYPPDADGATPIAYLWARTVRCESPNCGAEIPLARSFWLCKKATRRRALRHKVVRPKSETPRVEFEIFEPKNDDDVQSGTVTRAKATCVCCHTVLPPQRVRSQLADQRGGADVIFDGKGNRNGGAIMQAVVTLKSSASGRQYRLPTAADYRAVWQAQKRVRAILDEWERSGKKGLCPVPDEPTPAGGGSGAGRAFGVQKYGMMEFGDLFTARQKVALSTIAKLIGLPRIAAHHSELLALCLDRVTSRSSALCLWRFQADQEKVEHIFGRQALPPVWDFAESVAISDSTGSFSDGVDIVTQMVRSAAEKLKSGQVQQADACKSPLPDATAQVFFSDPPYYDAIPYSDLSDFFFVWLKRSLPNHSLIRDPFDPNNPLSPKEQEVVQDEVKFAHGKPKNRVFFEESMATAFREGRRVLDDQGIGSIVFAHKTTEGWEALLSGMTRGGWVITGSWPIATEMPNRLRARESAALSASVHLVCRPRVGHEIGDWGTVLRELPSRVGDWMERLQNEGVRGADLVFACIGPALEIFSRYAKVETADGKEVTLADYLLKVWEVVGRSALEQILGTAEAKARNGAAGALEEDARLTALFLWSIQSTAAETPSGSGDAEDDDNADSSDDEDDEGSSSKGKSKGYTLVYDVVRRFAQPLGIDLEKWNGRIIETKKGVVRLLPVTERAEVIFGKEGASAVADRLEKDPQAAAQGTLFPDMVNANIPKIKVRKGTRKKKGAPEPATPAASTAAGVLSVTGEPSHHQQGATTLDRIHAAMLLQRGGQTNALRALIKGEIERGQEFLRLANSLTALYPKDSEEKRLLDAMLLAVPR